MCRLSGGQLLSRHQQHLLPGMPLGNPTFSQIGLCRLSVRLGFRH